MPKKNAEYPLPVARLKKGIFNLYVTALIPAIINKKYKYLTLIFNHELIQFNI